MWPRIKQSVPKLTLSGKAKDCPQVLGSNKKYTSAYCERLPTFWKITDFCQTLWPETEHPRMRDDHPQCHSEREREPLAHLWSRDIRHHLLLILQDIAHLSGSNLLEMFARLAEPSQNKLLPVFYCMWKQRYTLGRRNTGCLWTSMTGAWPILGGQGGLLWGNDIWRESWRQDS